jgi:hypothetical protein
MMRFAIASVLLVACTTTKTVLGEGDDSPITSCSSVWTRGRPGVACNFSGPCHLETPDGCCTGFAACRDGTLLMHSTCTCGGQACETDDDCAYGITICGPEATCIACPSIDTCAACPDALERRVRNGCQTCTCTPKSQCAFPRGCETGACYQGQSCAEGCVADDPSCCANVCAAEGCGDRAPLGCESSACAEPCGTDLCLTAECACLGNTWYCSARCMPGATTTCRHD